MFSKHVGAHANGRVLATRANPQETSVLAKRRRTHSIREWSLLRTLQGAPTVNRSPVVFFFFLQNHVDTRGFLYI